MKILFNCLTMEKGGAERVIALFSNYFIYNNEVTILTLKKGEDAYDLDKKVKRVCVDKTSYQKDGSIKRLARKMSIRRLFGLRKIILAEGPDVIISFLPEPSLRLMFMKKFSPRLRKIPTIVSIRNDPAREYRSKLLKFVIKVLYKGVDGMVYQTEDAKRFFSDIVQIKNQVVIQNPIDENMLAKPLDDVERGNVMVSVGRLEAQKNQELLVKAFDRIVKEDKEHNFVLKIYGEGSRKGTLLNLIDELRLSDKVFLEGRVEDVAAKLNEAKIFILSSRYEGMPNALMEAMAMGLACVSTDCPCGGPRTLIKDGENGILVKNEDEAALAEAIKKMINNDRLRQKLAKNAVRIRETNNIDVIAEQWKNFIKEVRKKKCKV